MYPLETVNQTDTTRDFVNKFNNLLNHNRDGWRTLSYAIEIDEVESVLLFPATAKTSLLFTAAPHAFLVYDGETIDDDAAPEICLETLPGEANVCSSVALAPVPFEVSTLPLAEPQAVVDVSLKSLQLRVTKPGASRGAILHLFLHLVAIQID